MFVLRLFEKTASLAGKARLKSKQFPNHWSYSYLHIYNILQPVDSFAHSFDHSLTHLLTHSLTHVSLYSPNGLTYDLETWAQ